MNAELTVDGSTSPLTPKEAKLLLRALGDYRKGLRRMKPSVLEEFDLEVYGFKRLGYTDAEIARTMQVTSKRVRAAVTRVESGRYGDARLLG